MLEDVAQHESLGADADSGVKNSRMTRGFDPFVGRVEPGDVEAGAEQPLEEEALAAADLDQAPDRAKWRRITSRTASRWRANALLRPCSFW